MALQAGARLGSYEVIALIGAGGMGEVYRAHDTKLSRDVALKILPDAFALDGDRIVRFRREAQVLAALNHPNIAQIYGFEDSGITHALVLELVEGPTLADRIAKGRIPLDDALAIAQQIVEALDAAHEQGIIHRDLKPANIKVRDDGTVKVLDFGLAKAMEPEAISSLLLTNAPTVTTPAQMTGVGTILGTAAYMSPEQARGRPADKRSDVWAFGCVLFELLTSRPTFRGDTVAETIAEVLKSEPHWATLPPATPISVQRLLRRCLAKDRRRRLAEIGTARLEIDEALQPSELVTAALPARTFGERLAWLAAGALLCATLALGVIVISGRVTAKPQGSPEIRLQVPTPVNTDVYKFALSPDGTNLVYAQGGSLWLRSLNSDTPRRLADGGDFPFWSPDGRSIGFFDRGELRRVDLATGLTQSVAKAPEGMGGTWNTDGTILYARSHSSPVWRVSAGGGGASPMPLASGQIGQRFPQFLPDGVHYLYLAIGTAAVRGLYVGSLDSSETHKLFVLNSQAVFAPPDAVLFQRDGALLAQRIDLRSFRLIGDAVPVAARVALWPTAYNALAVSASVSGRVAYRPHSGSYQLEWLDRKGERVGTLGEPQEGRPYSARFSPDGHWLAIDRTIQGEIGVWAIDVERATWRRLTHSSAREASAAWSPDGRFVSFASEANGVFEIHRVNSDGSGDETVLSASSRPRLPRDWSSDGRFISFLEQSAEGGNNDLVSSLAVPNKPVAVAEAPAQSSLSRFSPDGHWIAYASADTGRNEIYVRRFPNGGAAVQVSTQGGTLPLWVRDRRELIYLHGNEVMSASFVPVGDVPKFGAPTTLFQLGQRRLVEVAPDGRRFIATEAVDSPAPIVLILNWAGPHR